jgi:hypothetical protein
MRVTTLALALCLVSCAGAPLTPEQRAARTERRLALVNATALFALNFAAASLNPGGFAK